MTQEQSLPEPALQLRLKEDELDSSLSGGKCEQRPSLPQKYFSVSNKTQLNLFSVLECSWRCNVPSTW